MTSAEDSLAALTASVRRFAEQRDWEQFHSPKNLAMALAAETAEILEIFQWMTEADSESLTDEAQRGLEQEVGDVLIYLIRLCDRSGIDPVEAAENKLSINAQKYPVEKSRGNSRKYTEL